MKESYLFDIGYIIKKEFSQKSVNYNLSEKSIVIALAIHNLFGGEIYCFAGGSYGGFYCNKINNVFYNFSMNLTCFNYKNSKPVDINSLYQDNNIVYNYHKFEIELIKEYMLYLRKHCEPIEEYLQLAELIPFLEKLYKQSLLYDKKETNNHIIVLKAVNGIINDMVNKFENIKFYLFLQDKLFECEQEYMIFKRNILIKKGEMVK